MKLRPDIANPRHCSAILLIECLVYIAVLAILTGVGMAAFYFCWDHTRATIFTANEVESALRAGENWRADVRAATGKISVEDSATGELVTIPEGKNKILYCLDAGNLRREIPAQNISRLLLAKVKTSEIKTEARDGVTVWCWELAVMPDHKESPLPMLFTFEAAQMKP